MNTIVNSLQDFLNTIVHWLPKLVGALLILLIGYIIAKSVEGVVKKLLKKAKFDQLVTKGTAGSYVRRVISSPAALLGSILFWVLWLAFFVDRSNGTWSACTYQLY